MKEVKTPKKPLAIYYAIVLLVLLILNFVIMPWASERQIKEVDYGTFMSMTEEKNIGRVDIESNQILFTDKENTQVYKTGLMSDPNLTERLYDAGAQFSSEIVEQASPLLSFLASFVLPIVIFVALGNYMNKKLMDKAGGGAGSMMFGGVGKSNAKVYVQSTHGIRFADVAGEDEAKENLQEIVDYLHDPSKYKEIGASMPKGILLVGPPGTGKTMLAKAVAGESNVPFFSMSGSEFVEMFVGMGASKVRDLFKQAKEKAPCIVFIDEIDAIGQKRNSGQYGLVWDVHMVKEDETHVRAYVDAKTGKVVAADVKGIQERRPGRGMGPGPRPQCPVTGGAPGTNPDCPMAGGFRHPGFHGYHHW